MTRIPSLCVVRVSSMPFHVEVLASSFLPSLGVPAASTETGVPVASTETGVPATALETPAAQEQVGAAGASRGSTGVGGAAQGHAESSEGQARAAQDRQEQHRGTRAHCRVRTMLYCQASGCRARGRGRPVHTCPRKEPDL